ncbi:MAG: type III secretion system effector protein [Simkaniaceae bacterium]|nr:type III secretion system effector protein [Simkaniaceae bacterium]
MSITSDVNAKRIVDSFIKTSCYQLFEGQKKIREALDEIVETPVGQALLIDLTDKIAKRSMMVIFKVNSHYEGLGLFKILGPNFSRVEVHEDSHLYCYRYVENGLLRLKRFSTAQVLFHEMVHLQHMLHQVAYAPGVEPSSPRFTDVEEEHTITGTYPGQPVGMVSENAFIKERGKPLRHCHGSVYVGAIDPDFFQLESIVGNETLELLHAYKSQEPFTKLYEENLGLLFARASNNPRIEVAVEILSHPRFDHAKYAEEIKAWFFQCIQSCSYIAFVWLLKSPFVSHLLQEDYTDKFFEHALLNPDVNVTNYIHRLPFLNKERVAELSLEKFENALGELSFQDFKKLREVACFKSLFEPERALGFAMIALENDDPEILKWVLLNIKPDAIEFTKALEDYWKSQLIEIAEGREAPSVEKMQLLIDLGAPVDLITKEIRTFLLSISPEYEALFGLSCAKRKRS